MHLLSDNLTLPCEVVHVDLDPWINWQCNPCHVSDLIESEHSLNDQRDRFSNVLLGRLFLT